MSEVVDWARLGPQVRFFTREEVLELVVKLSSGVSGAIIEFGVAEGNSTRCIRRVLTELEKQQPAGSRKKIYACDSFRGLPEKFEKAEVGTFACDPPNIPGVELVIGYFDQSLTPELAEKVGPVSFASFDADLYSSTTCALRWITPLLHPGSLLLFDEFLGENESEKRAFEDWSKESGVRTIKIAELEREPSGWGSKLDRRVLYQVVGEPLSPELGKEITDYAIGRIKNAEVMLEPFPHILVDGLVPDWFFAELLKNFPDRSRFLDAKYPGSGRNPRVSKYNRDGLVCRDFGGNEYFRIVRELFASEIFSRTLLTKFGEPARDGTVPIPRDKHRFFMNGARDHNCVFDLQIDLPGYEIAPHPDVREKIVTFQWFLVPDDELREFGTLLCKPKSGARTIARPRWVRTAGRTLDQLSQRMKLGDRSAYRKLELSPLGLELGLGDSRSWLPWHMFDIAKTAPASPNVFLAFAPSERSYHAVSMNVPESSRRQERPVLRGFIRSGQNSANWLEEVRQP